MRIPNPLPVRRGVREGQFLWLFSAYRIALPTAVSEADLA